MDDAQFWDQLLQLISENNVVPIIGRDLLTVTFEGQELLFYPLIAKRLAEYLKVSYENLPKGDEINTVVCRYIQRGNRVEDVYAALKIVMPGENAISVPEPLKQLASIRPFKLFITTTFDSLMKRALDEIRFSGEPRTKVFSYTPSTIEDLPISLRELDRPAVYHLFGKLSAIPAYAVTDEDILEFLHTLQSENRQPRFLLDELSRANLLILGCSFGNWLARFFLRTARRQRLLETRGSTDYLVDAAVSGDENLVLFLRHFSTRTKVYEGRSPSEFIGELYYRWSERTGTQSAEVPEERSLTGEDNLSGAVFLSYASEDLAAAVRIRDALEAEGVDVFFDKRALHAGDEFERKLRLSIAECSLFIPLISSNTLTQQRRFFRIEWNHAFDEARKVAPTERFILPVVIDNTSPTDLAIPEQFHRLHWEQLPEGFTNSSFVAVVKQLFRRYRKGTNAGL